MRLPRKKKKQAKKLVATKTALKVALSSIAAAQAMAQNAMIAATPSDNLISSVALKSAKISMNLVDTSVAIKRIMSEPPNSWKDFIRTSSL